MKERYVLLIIAGFALIHSTPSVEARSRGSVRSVNRSGGSATWSGERGSATANRSVTRDGDTATVNRNAQTSGGASGSTQKEIKFDDGRVESVERQQQATDRYGRSAEREGSAERHGSGWEFEGERENRQGRDVEVDGYAGRSPYGRGVVADVDGGRYGDRTVAAWKPHGGPTYVTSLPAGYRPYTHGGRSYYRHGGYYTRPVGRHYVYVPPPYGSCCYDDDDLLAAVVLTFAGTALLLSDGVYYETVYVEGTTQYQVVAAPVGAEVPQSALSAEAATVPAGGTTYYFYANTFYKAAPVGGKMSFIVVQKPAGVVTVKALPEDVQPHQAGSLTYLVAGGRYYMIYLDPSGSEQYIAVDPPKKEAVAARGIPLSVPVGTPLKIRLPAEISSGKNKTGDRFQAHLDQDLIAGGQLVAVKGAHVYGRVAEAKSGADGAAPKLAIELADIKVGGAVVPLTTNRIEVTGKAKKPGKKILGGALLGAGIGAAIDGGEGAAVGGMVGTMAGAAAASKTPGGEVAFAAWETIEFKTTQPVTLTKTVKLQQ